MNDSINCLLVLIKKYFYYLKNRLIEVTPNLKAKGQVSASSEACQRHPNSHIIHIHLLCWLLQEEYSFMILQYYSYQYTP